MDFKKIVAVAEEAARIKKDYPRLSYQDAVKKAKQALGYEKDI